MLPPSHGISSVRSSIQLTRLHSTCALSIRGIAGLSNATTPDQSTASPPSAPTGPVLRAFAAEVPDLVAVDALVPEAQATTEDRMEGFDLKSISMLSCSKTLKQEPEKAFIVVNSLRQGFRCEAGAKISDLSAISLIRTGLRRIGSFTTFESVPESLLVLRRRGRQSSRREGQQALNRRH